MSTATKAAVIGGGVIGGGWAARFLLNGWDVAVFDPDAEARRKILEVMANAERCLPALYDRALPVPGTLSFHGGIADAVAGADWVQESVPERIELKRTVLSEILAGAPEGAVVASSTSGFKPSDLQSGLGDASRVLVAHPFNPVYLLPLVEIVPSAATGLDIVARATDLLEAVGMSPLVIGQEIDAHIADRLLESVWREALWLIRDGVATTQEIDEAIRLGFGLRWAQMGLFETYRIAGGEAGMRHFLSQFGPSLKWPWTRLMDVPDLDEALVDRIVQQSDAQSGSRSFRQLERLRDDNLVAMLRALKRNRAAAGAVIARHEARLATLTVSDTGPFQTVDRQVPASWTDYNGHMNEAHYSEVFAQATDVVLDILGAGPEYVRAGHSYFTVESRISFAAEVSAGQRIGVISDVVDGDGRKVWLEHRLHRHDGKLAAASEHLLVHVDLTSRSSCQPGAEISDRVGRLVHERARRAETAGPSDPHAQSA